MQQFRFFILTLAITLLFIKSEPNQCGDERINNCKTCGKFEGLDSCGTCEDNYFLVMDKLLCIPCNDLLYGQAGCKGNCDASDYKDTSFAFCDECIDGYYNLEGMCRTCDEGSEGCKKCTYESEGESTSKEFKCQECLSSEYKLQDNYCQKCSVSNCDKCHYEGEEQKAVCDICVSGYYLNSEKTCSPCSYRAIVGGWCNICSDNETDYDSGYCYCHSGYVKIDNHTCFKCPDNCANCEYNKENNNAQCKYCDYGYAFDHSDGKCLKCEEGCSYCYVNAQKKTICTQCSSGKLIPGESKCLVCPSSCSECEYDATTSKSVCTKCDSNYVLNPTNKECVNCNGHEDTGTGCDSCIYNSTTKHYQCLSCYTYYYGSFDPFAYVSNIYKCFSNEDSSQIGLYGCLYAIYNEDSKKYECLSCKSGFIPVITDKSCIPHSSNGLSDGCYEAEKIEDKYSCTKCDSSYVFVKDIPSGINNCFERLDEFSFCLNGTINEDSTKICDVCSANSALNNSKICECNKDSFSKDQKFCYKCNDERQGNPGCDISKGCTYYKPNDELKCKQCLGGYFEYTEGQCFLCSNEISNCYDCHFDSSNNKLICDSCSNDIYTLNSENKCQLDDCEEYPEISPGCIICKDKLDEYLEKKQCQSCKYGYFKDKNNKCIYCKSEKYGGPACYECGYDDNNENNIICKNCYSNYYFSVYDYYYNYDRKYNQPALSSDGKCYDCQIEFSEYCKECGFVLNTDGTKTLKCTKCSIGHYLSPEGRCVSYLSLIQTTENCRRYDVLIGGMNFNINIYSYGYYNYYNSYNFTITSDDIKGPIKSTCIECYNKYFLNEEGKCEYLSFEKCTFLSVLNDYEKKGSTCRNMYWDYVTIYLPIKIFDSTNVNEIYISIWDLDTEYIHRYFIEQYGENDKYKTLLEYSGKGDETSPINLKNCETAYYFPDNDSYICRSCRYPYTLDNNTHTCIFKLKEDNYVPDYNKEYYCTVINSGTEENPSYSCLDSWYRDIQFTLVIYESNQTEFLAAKNELEGCISAIANSTYNKTLFNCNKCYYGYALYYSKFFGRYICQNIKGGVIRKKEISKDIFDDINEKVNATEEKTCNKDYLFTPDGKYCYKCDNEIIGNPGCKGGCSYSLERNDIIKCESGCKTGYIEASEGICAPCDSINEGCYECHYETEYPAEYKGIKRKRRFVCDYCHEGYLKSPYDTCLSCDDDLDLDDCYKCKIDLQNNNNNYVCTQCEEGHFIDEDGECDICDDGDEFKSFTSNKCVDCDDIAEGGIANCYECESDDKNVTCKECNEGYILLTNNNSCLEKMANKELQFYDNCLELTLVNNKLECTRCTFDYTLVDKKGCVYTPSLYDIYFSDYHRNHYLAIFMQSYGSKYDYYDLSKYFDSNYSIFKENDYIYKKNIDLFSCQEAVNLGTDDNPLYSCTKCNKGSGKLDEDEICKITEINSNISFCMAQYKNDALEYCSKATYKIDKGKEIYNCTECIKKYALTFNKVSKTYYCASTNATSKCLVLYCKNCNPNDGYICEECLPDYEVSGVTGSCVKKTEVIPAVTWKDIYKLEMNGVKEVNNKYIHGPTLSMVGITSSQINTRHAFLIYLTFKIKASLRYLEEGKEITMEAICEIKEGVEQTSNDVNLVEYECVGITNTTEDLSNYQLSDIKEANNEASLKKSNLAQIVNEMKVSGELERLETKTQSDFTIEDLVKIVIFQMKDNIFNISANDFKFNFNIEGTLNKEIVLPNPIVKDFELSEIEKNATCKFSVGENKAANLSCNLDVNNYKNIPTFSFKTAEIKTEDNEIYLSKLNDIILVNNKEKEKNDDKNKTVIIVIIVVCSVVGAVGIGIGVFFIVKKLKSGTKITGTNEAEEKNKNIEIKNDGVAETENRVIKYTNE